MKYDSALRAYTVKRIEEVDSAHILVGIPCYYNERTISHVIQMVTHGLAKYYNDKRCVIIIADGGSTDDTREAVKEFEIKPWQEKIVSIYRGPAGKGSAFRSIFEAAKRLKVEACMVVDSDLYSITSEWVRYLMEPIIEKGYQYVSPVYSRYKYASPTWGPRFTMPRIPPSPWAPCFARWSIPSFSSWSRMKRSGRLLEAVGSCPYLD